MADKKSATKKKTVNGKKKNVEKINMKNYLYVFLILFGSIIFALYIAKWYQVKHEEKLMNSYLVTSKTIDLEFKSLDDFNQIKQEAPSSYFIYLSYTDNEDVYKLEKELKRVIDKYKINDMFYYINLTDDNKENIELLNTIKTKLSLPKLENIPAIIYVNEGNISESNILDGTNGTMLKSTDLEKLLDIYDFEEVK